MEWNKQMANNSYHTLLTHFKQIKIQKYAREMHTRLENASNAADDNLPGNLPHIICKGPDMYVYTCRKYQSSGKIPFITIIHERKR